MRLSFVIPAYNEERYLGDCLRSIATQVTEMEASGRLCRGDVEIVVIDNASSDRTGEIGRRVPGVRVVEEPRKGLTFARQAGFAHTSGALLANVDADSRLTPGWLEVVLDTFEGQTAAGRSSARPIVAVSGPLVYYDLTPRQRVLVQIFYLMGFASYAVNRWVLRVGSMIQGGNFVVQRQALERIGGFDTGIAFYGEDTDIARRLNAVGRVRFTLRLKMFSSARRLLKEGMLTMAARYSVNYLWTTFFKRPFTDTYVDIRE